MIILYVIIFVLIVWNGLLQLNINRLNKTMEQQFQINKALTNLINLK